MFDENDRPFLKGEYTVDIQGRENEVAGKQKSVRSAFLDRRY